MTTDPAADVALHALSAALLSLTYREQVPPCADGSNAWTSDDHQIRAVAIPLCTNCSLLDLCAQYGDEIKASAAVYGGTDRTPTTRKAMTA
jgi:hypothetical protein